jgi:hypothetical protein
MDSKTQFKDWQTSMSATKRGWIDQADVEREDAWASPFVRLEYRIYEGFG